MISLDQILILEQKIESAVAKIAQLTAENDALRSKCAELTNALSAKTEQLSAFQSDQNKIELGIIKALEQLDNIDSSNIIAVSNEIIANANSVSSITNTNVNTQTDNTPITQDTVQENTIQNEFEKTEASIEDNNTTSDFDSNNSYNDDVASDYQNDSSKSEFDEFENIENNEQIVESPMVDNHLETSEDSINDITPRERDIILELVQKGWSVEDISATLKKNVTEITKIVTENNFTTSENNQSEQTDDKPIFDIF